MLPLASFGEVGFGSGCWSVYWPPITCPTIQAGNPTAIDMYQNGSLVASPGPITNGNEFTDTYY